MHASTLQRVLEHLRKLTDPACVQDLNDADLLERFRLRREEAAFTLLVQRHGPMVLAVCRRILGDVHEAEDAFQATFLVLVRNAAAIRKQEALAGWLHGVASRISHKARRRLARQQLVGQAGKPNIHDDPSETLAAAELRAVLDEEIERLPDKYRMPLVLCYLADKTHEQAAVELGWPKSSVTARLARARELLQRRLTRRGFTAPAGLLAALLIEPSANASLPSLLTLSTVHLAAQALAGETLAATSAAGLAGGFVKGAVTLKRMATLSLLAMLGFAAVGYRMAVPGPSSSAEQPASKSPTFDEHQGTEAPRSPQARKPRVDLQGDPLPDEAIARVGSGRLRHPYLRALLFSSDNKRLLSSADKGLRIWDAATGKLVQRFDLPQGHKQTSCRWLSNSFIGIDVDTQGIPTVQILDTTTGRVRRRVRIKEPAINYYPSLSSDGKRFAVAHPDNQIRLYDTTTGETLQRIPFKGFLGVWSIAFAPDGKSVAFSNFSDTIYIHDVTTGQLIRELKRPGDAKLKLVFSPDGHFLASLPQNLPGQHKGEVSVWNLQDGKEIQRWTHPFPMAASAAFSPDGKRVAFGGSQWGLVLRDVETGKEVYRLSPQGGVFEITFSLDGKTLATASPDGVIRLWDAATGKLLPASADTDVSSVEHLRFSADGQRLFGISGVCLIWDSSTGRELRRMADPKPWDFKHATYQHFLALSPDESLMAAAHPEEGVVLVDAATGKQKRILKGGDRWIYRLAFTPDGRRLVTSGEERKLRIWDVASGRELRAWSEQGGLTACLAISADGRWLASAPVLYRVNKYDVTLWDLATGKEKRRFFMTRHCPMALAFSPDGRFLAAVGGDREQGEVRIWDLQTGQEQRRLEGRFGPLTSVAFSPDGRTLAAGGVDGQLGLWELASGCCRYRFRGHESRVLSLAFSPRGRRLAASSVDAPVYVWDVAGTLQFGLHHLSNDELQRSWNTLAGEDAVAAFQAIRRLAAAPEQTVPFLRQRLKSVLAPEPQRIRQLVQRLDSDDFATRQKAAEELEKQGDAAVPMLRQIMTKEKPSLEVRQRLQQILESVESKPESLRAGRAVEVLEWIATPDAVQLLNELANGVAEARLTREASAAKQRLSR
jgi:RNA polymerase sigma factor (sigma-70 family)